MMFTGCCLTLASLGMQNGGDGGDEEEVRRAAEGMNAEELGGLRKVFDMFDANRDGFLTLEELFSWMEKLGRPMTKAALLRALESCDWDHDGRLDFSEFVALTQSLHSRDDHDAGKASNNNQSHLATHDGEEAENDPKSELKEAFQVFDKDGNGLISPTELRATLCELGLLTSTSCLSRVHSMIKKVDQDGDGQVSFSEFETMMNGK